ncbi:MAG: fibronectin type III-like domain-contianing protein, partial [Lachnospiraceae bacterium]|nr:fibronectin type III-like domain-contianing protein [Lachnospiraceae bacterium]
RYYDTKKQPVRWAFGHGLSYTSFAYSNLHLSAASMGDEDVLSVSADITNTGNRSGKEAVQLYVSDRNGTFGRPAKELKGFTKVSLAPGETKTVTWQIRARDLSYYHTELGDWYAPSGTYGILVGSASDDIRLEGEVNFVTAKLLPMTIDGTTTLGDLMADPRTAPVLSEIMKSAFGAAAENDNAGMNSDDATARATMNAMPLKSLASFAAMPQEQYDAMLQGFRAAAEA